MDKRLESEYEDGAKIVALYTGTLANVFSQLRYESAYYKKKVESCTVTIEGFEGDEHSKGHGGIDRAINHYPQEDYQILINEFPDKENSLCADDTNGFGENISTVGGNMNFHTICIGDRFRVGSCILEVSQPRYPCKKVNYRHEVEGFTLSNYVISSCTNGWFYRVIQPGKISVGDVFTRISHPYPEMSLYIIQSTLYGNDEEKKRGTLNFLQEFVDLEPLADHPWKKVTRKLIEKKNIEEN